MKNSRLFKCIAVVLVLAMSVVLFAACAQTGENASTEASVAETESAETATAETVTQDSSTGLKRLTYEDVMGMVTDKVQSQYMDTSMTEPVPAVGLADLELTDAEKETIRGMNLEIAIECYVSNDSWNQQTIGIQEICDDLNITIKDVWMPAEPNGTSQLEDYTRIEAIADQYDGLITLPCDVSTSSDILAKIMEKTTVTTLCSAPFNVDWTSDRFGGVADAGCYTAGLYSAEAAIKILNGSGSIGVVGYIVGKEGGFNTVGERYRGWDAVFAEHPEVNVVDQWFDDPTKVGDIVNSMLAANPDIKVLLVDWANSPGVDALTVLKQRGLTSKDIALVTIDVDDAIAVPMAENGANDLCQAYATQDWYSVGKIAALLFANNIIDKGANPKFAVTTPPPVTVYENILPCYQAVVPASWEIPETILALKDQWDIG